MTEPHGPDFGDNPPVEGNGMPPESSDLPVFHRELQPEERDDVLSRVTYEPFLAAGREYGDSDQYRDPRTPEEWQLSARTSMEVLAYVASTQLSDAGVRLDPNQSLQVNTAGTAIVDFHEGETEATSLGDDALPYQKVVKIIPIPRKPEPPANAPMSVLREAAAKYERERAEKTEISWTSANPGTIVIARQTAEAIARSTEREELVLTPYAALAKEAAERGVDYQEIVSLMSAEDAAGREQIPLNELSPDEQQRYAEMIRGAATMAAAVANRPDLVARVRNIWLKDF